MSEEKGFWDKVGKDARVQWVSRMIPETGSIPRDAIVELVASARQYVREFAVLHRVLARAINTSESYISDLFKIRRPADVGAGVLAVKSVEKLVRDIKAWMEADFSARQNRRPDNFVMTAAAELIMNVARNVHETGTIGIIDGPAGMGKTITIQQVAAQLPGTMVVTGSIDTRTERGLLAAVHQAARLKRRATHGTVRLSQVVERLTRTNRLLIVDQAQDLRDSAYKLLMDLHDASGIPILLVGTIDIHKRLSDDQDVHFGQLASRIGLRVHLYDELIRPGRDGKLKRWIHVSELRRIFGGGKLKLRGDTARALGEVANFQTGHLRRAKWLFELARRIAAKDDKNRSKEILPDHLRTAIRWVEGEERALPLPPTPAAPEQEQAATA